MAEKGPGGVQVGRVTVQVAPDTSKFGEDTKKGVEKETKSLSIDIPIKGEVDQEQIKRAIESIRLPRIEAPISVSRTQVRAAIDAALLNMKPTKTPVIPVRFDRTQVKEALRTALADQSGGAVSVPVSFSRAQVRESLRTAVTGISSAAIGLEVQFTQAQVKRALREATAGMTNATVNVNANFTRTQIRTAWATAITGLDLTVPVNAVLRPSAVKAVARQIRDDVSGALGPISLNVSANTKAIQSVKSTVQKEVNKNGGVKGPDVTPQLRISKFMGELKNSNNAILRTFAATFNGIGQSMQSVFQDLPTALSSGFGNIGKTLTNTSKLIDSIGDSSKNTGKILGELGASLIGTFLAASGLVLRLGAQLAGLAVIGAGITGAFGAIVTAIAALPAVIGLVGASIATVMLGMDGIKKAAKTLKPEFDTLKAKVSDAFEKGLTPVFKNLKGTLTDLTPTIVDNANALVRLAAGFQQYITKGNGAAYIKKIFENTTKAIDDMRPGLIALIDGFLNLASTKTAMEALSGFINTFGKGFKKVIDDLKGAGDLDAAFIDLKQVLESIANLLNTSFKAGIQIFEGGAGIGFKRFLDGVNNLFTRIDWERIGKAVGDVFSGLGEIIKGIKPETIEKITQAFEKMGALFRDPAFQQNIQKIIDALPAFIDFATKLIEWAGKIGGALADMFKWIGGDNAAAVAAIAGIGLIAGKIIGKFMGLFKSLKGIGKLFSWSDAIPEIDVDKDVKTKGGKKKKFGDLFDKGKGGAGGGLDLPEIDVDKDVKTKGKKKKKMGDLFDTGGGGGGGGGGIDLPEIDVDRDVKTKGKKKKKMGDLFDVIGLADDVLETFNNVGPGAWAGALKDLVGPVGDLLSGALRKLLGFNTYTVEIDTEGLKQDIKDALDEITWDEYGQKLADPLKKLFLDKAPDGGGGGIGSLLNTSGLEKWKTDWNDAINNVEQRVSDFLVTTIGTGYTGSLNGFSIITRDKLNDWASIWEGAYNRVESRYAVFVTRVMGIDWATALNKFAESTSQKLQGWREAWNDSFNNVESRFTTFVVNVLGLDFATALDAFIKMTASKLDLWRTAWNDSFNNIEQRFFDFQTIILATNYVAALDLLIQNTNLKLQLWREAWNVSFNNIEQRFLDFQTLTLGTNYLAALDLFNTNTTVKLQTWQDIWGFAIDNLKTRIETFLGNILLQYTIFFGAIALETVLAMLAMSKSWTGHLLSSGLEIGAWLLATRLAYELFFQSLVTTANTSLQNITTAFQLNLNAALVTAQTVLGQIVNVFGQAFGNIQVIVSNQMTIINQIYAAGLQQILASTQQFANVIPQVFINMANTILQVLSNFINTIVGAFQNSLAGAFVNAAIAAAQGFIEKIDNMIQIVLDKLTAFINQVIGIFNSLFSIGSPSRVMMKIGQYVMEGFAIGLENKSGQALDQMTATGSGVISAAQSAGAAIGDAMATGMESQSDAVSEAAQKMVADAEKYANQAADAISKSVSAVDIDSELPDWRGVAKSSTEATDPAKSADPQPLVGQMTIETTQGATADQIMDTALFRLRHVRRGVHSGR